MPPASEPNKCNYFVAVIIPHYLVHMWLLTLGERLVVPLVLYLHA